MQQIIYILGSGHSGSTLLDRIIGSNPECFSVGEIRQWSKALEKPELFIKEANVECSCGKEVKECGFYAKVTGGFQRQYKIDAHLNLRNYLSLLWNLYTFKDMESVRIPRDDYLELIGDIEKTTGHKILVDSSKTLINLIKLIKSGQYHVKLIYLSRDIRGVANSYNKIPYYNFYLSVINWVATNILYRRFLKAMQIRHIKIGYDNLARNPDIYIRELGDWLGMDITGYINGINQTEYHQIAGNNVRFREFKGIRYDNSWKRELKFFKRSLVQLFGLVFNRRFVYRDFYSETVAKRK